MAYVKSTFFRWNIRSLFVLVAIAAVPSLIVGRYMSFRTTVSEVKRAGGSVYFDKDVVSFREILWSIKEQPVIKKQEAGTRIVGSFCPQMRTALDSTSSIDQSPITFVNWMLGKSEVIGVEVNVSDLDEDLTSVLKKFQELDFVLGICDQSGLSGESVPIGFPVVEKKAVLYEQLNSRFEQMAIELGDKVDCRPEFPNCAPRVFKPFGQLP